jgi:phosphoribosyl 1,2-cyclic phosphate phosphodiesterase
MIRLRFLGTGTSQGVPVIGCDCEVCVSDDPRDNRNRVSVLIESPNTTIVVDVGPDFRQQMLREKVKRLDAVLLTHEHNDHVIGLDDVRTFNFRQGIDMPIFTLERVINDLRVRFAYAFSENPYPGVPRFDWHLIDETSHFKIKDIDIQCIGIQHGTLPILGFRFGDIAYCTDVKRITEIELSKLKNLKILVLSALHDYEHHAHLTFKEALELIERLAPEKAYLTHMSHHAGLTANINEKLPPHVKLAYDGLVVEGK